MNNTPFNYFTYEKGLDNLLWVWDAKNRHEDDPEAKICLFRGEDFHFDKGMILGAMARVFIENRNEREDGEIYWTYDRVDLEDDLPLGMLDDNVKPSGRYGDKSPPENRVVWTPERHAFFVSINDAMAQLILKIKHLADPEKLKVAMESKQPLITTDRTW